MRVKRIFLVWILLFFSTVHAAEKVDLRRGKNSQYSKLIQRALLDSTKGGRVTTSQATTLKKRSIQVNRNNELRAIKINRQSAKITHVRLRQYYKNVPIWGHQIRTSIANGKLGKIRGHMIQNIESDLDSPEANFSEEAALQFAKEELIRQKGKKSWRYENERVNPVIFLTDEKQAKLAYEVSFYAEAEGGFPTRPYLIINAKTKQVLKQWDGLTY